MIIGNASVLAIESSITKAYERLGQRALGFFVVYVGGFCYGKRSADSTMLACSFDEVGRRIATRGTHTLPFADEADAGKIAGAFRDAVYGDEPLESHFGIPSLQLREMMYSKRMIWAPDGDEAFDDGSYILQFDIKDHVRVVGFKSVPHGGYDPATLRDIRLAADDFYQILQQWYDGFKDEWASLPKA